MELGAAMSAGEKTDGGNADGKSDHFRRGPGAGTGRGGSGQDSGAA